MSRLMLTFLCISLLAACKKGGSSGNGDPAEPAFDPANLTGIITNPFLPMVPGTTMTYEGDTDEGTETIVVTVSHLPENVLGVLCTQVVDRAYLDGDLIEETFDWYAADAEGNTWYLGEASAEYENGQKISEAGSWRAGEDGAVGGILIKAKSVVGDSYQQEFLAGVAEDRAKVVALDVPVTLSDNSSFVTVKTEEWTPLEPNSVHEYKYFAPGVGLVKEEKVDGSEFVELISITRDTEPVIVPARFSSVVDHPYLPLPSGLGLAYEGLTDEGLERFERTVSGNTVVVMGVECIEVEDRAWIDGELVEVALDWFAQDDDGNVWYFGEAVDNYENGMLVDHDGSWESGVDGAVPGVVMPAMARVGDTFRQEYYEGEAEDLAALLSLDDSVSITFGDFDDCLRFLEWNPLEPEASREHKLYAPGVGLILEQNENGADPVELIGTL